MTRCPADRFAPLRSAVVLAHTREFLDRTAFCANQFGMLVAEQYLARVAPDLREQGPNFKWGVTTDELCEAQRHNGQLVRRYLNRTLIVFPADLEDAWVSALPDPYRSDCERELAQRRGLIPYRAAAGNASSSCGALAREFGQLLEALAPAIADGRLNARDRKHAQRIVDEADDLIGQALGVREEVKALLAQGNGRAGRSKR